MMGVGEKPSDGPFVRGWTRGVPPTGNPLGKHLEPTCGGGGRGVQAAEPLCALSRPSLVGGCSGGHNCWEFLFLQLAVLQAPMASEKSPRHRRVEPRHLGRMLPDVGDLHSFWWGTAQGPSQGEGLSRLRWLEALDITKDLNLTVSTAIPP